MKYFKKVSLVMGSLAVAASSHALGAYDSIVASANWADTVSALAVVAAAMAVALAIQVGYHYVIDFIDARDYWRDR